MIRALLLDFDGLILDTETPLLRAWSRVHADAGLVFDEKAGQQIIGHSGVFYDPWSAFGPDADRPALEAAFQRYKEAIIVKQPILSGVVSLLDHARDLELTLAVVSNSHHDHVDGHLARLGLNSYFQATFCRDDVAHPKPAPDVYQAACQNLAIEPSECIAFEDSVPGHLAAHAAGLRVVVVPNPSTRHYDFPHSSIRLDSLADYSPSQLLQRLD